MQIIRLPHLFTPREYQTPVMRAFFYGEIRKLFLVWHRRAGKDLTCINILIAAAMQRRGTYLFLLPQTNQARKVIWRGMDAEGIPFLERIPKSLIHRKNKQEMSVDLINGSIIQLGGSNNYDALMGTNPVGIINSEYPLHSPQARQHFAPILAENGGWEICEGTPRGTNHAYKVYQGAMADRKEWFTQLLTVEDTKRPDGSPVITQEDIERERRGGMSEEMIRQEFYCDWNVGLIGAYYTKELDAAEKEGRITRFAIDPRIPVYTFWDIGVHDATAIWWMQPKDGYLHMINYYEATDQGIEHFIQKIHDVGQALNIKYATHFAPHDMANREWGGNARSRLNIAISLGISFSVIPAKAIEDGIQAVRSIFPRVKFHIDNCRQGIDALREYRRKYDEINRVFMTAPLHNWASNCSDSFRYMAIKWSDLFTRPNTPIHYDFPGL